MTNLGEDTSSIYNTGCPSLDIVKAVTKEEADTFNPFAKYSGVGAKLDWQQDFLVVLQHPVTNELNSAFDDISATLQAIEKLGFPTLWFWPNVDAGSDSVSKGIRGFRERGFGSRICYFKNMEPQDFLKVLKKSKCLVGNSSAGIRECSMLGVPVVNIGTRQAGRLRGKNVLDCKNDVDEIIDAVSTQLKHGHYSPEQLYGDGNAGKKIADVLATSNLKYHKTIAY